MYPVNFSKERAEVLLDCLSNGKPIPAPERGWTLAEMLTLAGACHCAMVGWGPLHHLQLGFDIHRLSQEQQEAHTGDLCNDLNVAIEIYSQLMIYMRHGTYDAQFDPIMEAQVE